MSWRKNMCTKTNEEPLAYSLHKAKIPKPTIKNITSVDDKTSEIRKRTNRLGCEQPTVEKMTTCLHGKPCNFLSSHESRAICEKSGNPVFDMAECPRNLWQRNKPVESSAKTDSFIFCTNCEHGTHKTNLMDSPILWCALTDAKAYDLFECCLGHWYRDVGGRILEGKNPNGRSKPNDNSVVPAVDGEHAQADLPSNCQACPACGLYEGVGSGYYCFHTAYFLGKSGKPKEIKSDLMECLLRKV